jgi:steroid delta-isomerase-like uncharacterized protein
MYSQIRNISIACIILIALGGVFQAAAADTEANKAIMLRAEEFWNTGDMAIADEVYAAELVNHDPTAPDVRDFESLKGFAAAVRAGLPNFHVTNEYMIAEGDKVAGRWTATATQTGEFFGIPPTGKQTTWTGISIYRFADGKVVEAWWSKDSLGLMQQLGVMPPTRESYTWGEPSAVTGDPGDPETNKAILRRLFDEVSKGNLDVSDELMAADYVFHDPVSPVEMRGPEGYKQHVAIYPAAFPDMQLTLEDMIAEGDQVAARFTFVGTHEGELMGIPATGRRIVMTGINIYRLADGKFVETWASYDAMGLMQQLTAPEWPIAGSWICILPIPGLGDIILEWTVNPQDLGGQNFTTVSRPAKPEATLFGTFPDADHQSDHIGQTVKTGLNTYESTMVGYGTKKAELPGMLPEIVYISVLYGKTQLIDENTMQGEGTHAFYLPSADADGDGLPDEGQEPIACFPYANTSKRVQLMPPCVP